MIFTERSVQRKRRARAVLTGMCYSAGSVMLHGSLPRNMLKWSTKTGHRVRVFPVSIFRFVWG
ncbi:hypothetical protein A3376_25430 [Escherichia coli]|nr:hypothetical protein [Escherichia coli]